MIHQFTYALKSLFRNKMLIFWTFAFPIIMAFFFNIAFSNIVEDEKLDVFPIAIVQNQEWNNDEIFQKSIEALGKENSEDRLFSLHYTANEQEAKKLLEDEEITGYLIVEKEDPKIVVKKSGIEETVFQNVIQEIEKQKNIVVDLITQKIEEQMKQGITTIDQEKIINEEVQSVQEKGTYTAQKNENNHLDYTMIEYYTLIAMACLYGAILGMTAINNLLANMSTKGMRVSVAPVKRMKMIISSSLAALVTQIIGLVLLFAFTLLIIKVDYGEKIFPIILLAFVGALAGLSLGVFVGTVLKRKEDTKMGILIAVTMLGCFFSGMMGITMKYIIDTTVPIINKINPASMITDGFYALYYYSGLERYWVNVISLVIFSIVLIALSTIALRRQKYDSI
jgi:ABC-2 type transport system permease protein